MAADDAVFELITLLDRLEELREELLELGLSSLDDIETRLRELEALLDDLPDGDANGPV
ncbi:MAG TPA: hypothetical protein VMM78_09065 [Thermomicrobiales bacterium]|nr:hypothetical protein [Thermomicrobiales bacterium]